MNLYYHLDRNTSLTIGSSVNKEAYYNESILVIWSPFMNEDYINHLNQLSKDGLSLHGARYLIDVKYGNVDFASFCLELYFEYIRWKFYNHLPSRFQNIFAWKTYEQELNFAKKSNSGGKIYQINSPNNFFIGDMNLLKLDLDYNTQEKYAHDYWKGKTLSTDINYEPCYEYVINLPFNVISEVLINPLQNF